MMDSSEFHCCLTIGALVLSTFGVAGALMGEFADDDLFVSQ
jgi:hypothetical protein